ncbi:MAG: hypothetical protein WDN69_21235 [Aliidongia sp.]
MVFLSCVALAAARASYSAASLRRLCRHSSNPSSSTNKATAPAITMLRSVSRCQSPRMPSIGRLTATTKRPSSDR